ncbi:hypothetical protein Rhopal_003911-T1 [Rhodotorula paludigena]|uniref:General negative regulator of transcription subunit n=1 Tax=Rhodotorula paludigena TaxID=86838 RepID=A0AAV5GNF5_9BASI|nr:hypothetical protein Rhopal_003911-T1 [Rhodotorula paludigena]
MAARKLQTEIDKTLKKVSEGVEVFEGIFDKIQASSNQTQKEKLEQDLKTQIKKLQRLRDQIKTWMASNDIKDKQPLIDNRKLIETQMERFKACEKEMKTKAFSKEGLNAATKLDPKEKEKLEMCQWIQSMVEELGRQVEQAEAEVETIQGTKQKKKDSEREARLEELERLNERRSWHVNRLELILRLLENGNLPTDSVTNVKDDIAYFVESNTEEDFEEDEGIYDELNLEDEEEMFGIVQDDHQSSHDSVSVADEPAPPPVPPIPKTPAKAEKKADEPEKTPAKPKASVAATPQKKPSLDAASSRPPPAAAAASTPSRSVSGPASATPARSSAPAPALPPIRYAAAAAAANASAAPSSTAAPAVSSPGASASGPPPGLAPPAASAPSPASPVPTAAPVEPAKEATASQASSAAPSPALAAPAAPSPSLSSTSANPASQPSNETASSEPSSEAAQAAAQAATAAGPQQPSKSEARLPSSLADLVTSFESAKQKSMRRDQDLSEIDKVLEAGLSNVPQPLDAEKPKYYVPRTPYATPTYYPQEPSSQFASPALFAKLDVDTLFYIFYYCPGTYLQFLAANELKKQSWRFHKQYLTWFQRANEPTTITDSYEQGVYLYFDWEGSWCQRKKNDFRFQYDYLEV